MKKNVLIFIDSLTCGGAEKSLVSLLPLLDYSKVDVDLMMVNRGGVFEQYVPDQVEIVEASLVEKGVERRLRQLMFSFLLRWNKLIGKQVHGAELQWKCLNASYKPLKKEYDVAIAYQQGFPTYYVAEKVKAKKKIAWVNVNIFNAGYNPQYNTRFYDRFDNIVPVSEDLLSIMKEHYPQYCSKYVCVYDILNPNIIREYAETPIADVKCSEGITLTTTGRMVYQKNYTLAVETAKILRDKGIRLKWNFVGDGGERPAVEELIKKYHLENEIMLWGMQPNPYPYMAAADIYVQTSRFEGFGLTIAEAKILGKPVVSTNFDVVHDQLKHEVNGLIAEMTPESLAEEVLRLIGVEVSLVEGELNGVEELSELNGVEKLSELGRRIVDNVNKEENTTYITEAEKVMKMMLS